MPGLGDEFRAAREARHLSLSDVSEQLHIRSLYLQSIEREEWGSIGAAVYVRGFIRAYARFLGLDPERALAEFNAVRPPVDPATRYAAIATPSAAANLRAAPAASKPSPRLTFATLVAFVLVVFVGYNFFQVRAGHRSVSDAGTSATSAASSVATSAATSIATSAATSTATSAATTSAAAVAGNWPVDDGTPGPWVSLPAAGLGGSPPLPSFATSRTIEVRLTDRSWLRVEVDGAKVLEGVFPAGTRKEFHGRSVYVRAGNAGGVVVVVNGKDEGTMGPAGDVVERTFTLAQE